MTQPSPDRQFAFGPRDGEISLDTDPSTEARDGAVVFIGTVASPWVDRADCPKNMAAARERGRPAQVLVDVVYRRGLQGLERASHVIILSWLDRSPRNLIVQKARHAAEAKGVFGLRSPARPNPIGVHVARLLRVDHERGVLDIDAIDVLDGTPIIDLKPYLPSIDAFPDAVMDGREGSR